MKDEGLDRPSAETGAHADPLPTDWLPEALPPEGDSVWDSRTERILAMAERNRTVRESVGSVAASWPSEMGGWLTPAAALAAAALALAFLTSSPPRIEPSPTADAMALGIVASDGEPAALWAALGVQADPVLARLALEDHSRFVVRADVTAAPGESR
jgi:hypothetical protein